MERNLFVYGTLTLPEVLFAVTGKHFSERNAQLKDHKKFCVVEDGIKLTYSGIIPQNGGIVEGK
jgi:hypothetical protein